MYMQLETAGYDIRGFYTDRFIKSAVKKAAIDQTEIDARASADQYLAKVSPVEVKDGKYSTRTVSKGANGYTHCITNEQEAADCDVLGDGGDILLDNDIKADRLSMFSDCDDSKGLDKATTAIDTGAQWYNGFRISSELQSVLQPHYNLTNMSACFSSSTTFWETMARLFLTQWAWARH